MTSEFPPLPGGIGNHAFNLAKYLQHNGFQVEVITDQRTEDKIELEFDRIQEFEINRVKLKKFRPLMYVNRFTLLFSLVKQSNTVIATGKFSLWSVGLASLFYKRNYLAVVHGTEVNFTRPVLRKSINWSLKRFSKIIAVSKYTKSLISHLSLKHVVVIPNGVDIEDSAAQINENSVKLELQGHPKLLTVGNITERKGQNNVIRHLPELIKAFPKVHYHCVGFPTEKAKVLQLATTLQVEKYVTFHGHVNHNKLKTFLQEADVFVMLSNVTPSGDVEGFGIAILEANHFGLPAIGSLDCGIEDAIVHDQTGLLINAKDTKAFVESVKLLLERRDEFSQESKLWSKKHNWESVIKAYIKVINSL